MTELACYTYSLVSVPLYDTLGTEAIAHILDKGSIWEVSRRPYRSGCSRCCCLFLTCAASISTVVCDVKDKVNLILDCFNNSKHFLKTIVLMEEPSESLVERGRRAGIQILTLQEMEVKSIHTHMLSKI